MLRKRSAVPGIALERALYTIYEILVSKRLLQEIESALLHGLDRHGNVAVPGDEDDWQRGTPQIQLLLQLDAAHAGHAHIEHQATGLIVLVLLEKLAGRGERTGVEAH